MTHVQAVAGIMTTLPDDGRVEDPLQEVQALQKDLKAFSRAVHKPLRDNISYSAFAVDATHSPRRVLPASQNPGDVAILDRLKFVRSLPGKAQTAALVRQALTLQDGNARIPSTSSTPPPAHRRRRLSAQQSPRQDLAGTSEAQAPVTAADFQDQLYEASGAIDLTRVRLKIKQHQQDLIAAGLQEPPEEPEPIVPDSLLQNVPQSKLRWQLAAGNMPIITGTDYTLSQHEKQSIRPQDWMHVRKLWEDDTAASSSQDGLPQALVTEPFSQQPSGQLQQQLPGQPLHQSPGHAPGQPSASDPAWNQGLSSSALPQETRQDNSFAAYQCLLDEEAQRMLLHASPDGTQFPAKSFLRTPQHLVPLVEACKCLQGLKTLDLSLNALSDTALPQLQRLMEAGVQLSSLDLSQNQLSSQAAAPLCSLISHISQSVLPHASSHQAATVFHDVAQTSDSAAQHTNATESSAHASGNLDSATQASTSQDVHTNAMTASGELQSDSAASSSAAAPANTGPGHFGGSHSRLAGVASTSASEAPSGPSLRRLVLSHNPLGDRGLEGLAGGCPQGREVALTDLALAGCRLGCLCAKPLSVILRDWVSLRQLTLAWNDLGLRGAQVIAQALKGNHSLVSLDLSQCGLTDMGGAGIALSLADNRGLQHLDISSNQLQAATCAALGHVLSTGCQLQHLRLDMNPLGKQGAVALVQAAASSNCKLQQLQMHGCGIADHACIQKAIQVRAAEALENAKPKKKAKKKKKAAKGKEEAAGTKKKKREEPAAAAAAKPGVEHYALDLALPSDWAKLMGLVQTARSGTIAWKGLVVAGKKRPGPLPPETWPTEMPTSGKVEFDVKAAPSKSGDAAAATASTSAAATEGALRADDSFCQLIGGNLTKETQCLDDWRLQLLELLPAAGIQLTEAQALKLGRAFPGLLEGLLRSEDQHRALTALGQCCKQMPVQLQAGSAAQQAGLSLTQMSLT